MRYLYSKDGVIHAECDVCKKELKFKERDISQVAEGVECFCGNVSSGIEGLPLKESAPVTSAQSSAPAQRVVQQVVYAQPSGPRCPTCQSTNIQKISLASKAVGGYMFGIFSSNVRNTFKCNNCGYKW